MNTSYLIQPRHLDRRAVIYVRQSSPNQVLNNQESRRLQYALRERAAQQCAVTRSAWRLEETCDGGPPAEL